MCPTFVSKKGVWLTAKEKIGLVYKGSKVIPKGALPEGVTITGEFLHPNDPFMYDGPDRAALIAMHKENGGQSFGVDFRSDPEFLQAVRNRGFNNVDEYLKMIAFDEAAEDKKFEEKVSSIKSHEIPKRVEAIEILAGGKDFAGTGNDIVGGFGEEKINKPSAKIPRPNITSN